MLTSNDRQGKRYTVFFSLLFVVLFILLMLVRDVSAPNDFGNYTIMYEQINSFSDVWVAYHKNYTFSFLQYLGSVIGLSSEQFHTIFSLIISLLVYRAFHLLFEDKKYALIAFALFLLSSTFIFLYANVLRQGLALSLMMLSSAYYWKRKRFSFLAFSVLAFFAHFSAILFFIAVVLAKWLPLRKAIGTFHLILLPLLPIIGYLLIDVVGVASLLQSVEKYSNYDYSSKVFYVKLVVSYLFLVSLFILNKNKYVAQSNENLVEKYTYIYSIYGYLIAASFSLLSIPLMSARVHYFSNALMPMLAVTFLFSSFKLRFEFKIAIVVVVAAAVGMVSYFYPSSASQLGVYGQ